VTSTPAARPLWSMKHNRGDPKRFKSPTGRALAFDGARRFKYVQLQRIRAGEVFAEQDIKTLISIVERVRECDTPLLCIAAEGKVVVHCGARSNGNVTRARDNMGTGTE
jgi:hypothetical protein